MPKKRGVKTVRKHLTIRCSEEEHQRISEWSAKYGINRSQLLKVVILNHIQIQEGTSPSEWFELDYLGRVSWQ